MTGSSTGELFLVDIGMLQKQVDKQLLQLANKLIVVVMIFLGLLFHKYYLDSRTINGMMVVDIFNKPYFYLPMDGNSPIGQDKSGNGNDWTPVNFGGSVALDNPQVSGARPILNTTQGGTQAGVGVFGSKENKYYTVTTANGSVYQFDITSGDNPSLSFIRGATYKFDYSSFTGHPVLFSSTNPDSSTTAYTDGTSIASNVISFTVPHDAPDTLYYYCQNHPTSMNGSISITTDETKADPYAWKNILALPLVGSANDVSAVPLRIGILADNSSEPFNGFISNARIIKGTALYTTNFTPPTRELTNVTNTKLLCCQSNTLAGSAAVSPNISGINDGTVWRV
jgi:hypothetical protein